MIDLPHQGNDVLRRGHALVLDDDRVDQMSHRRLLVKSGHFGRVTAFAMAIDALVWLREDADDLVDLILFDIHLPGMTGFDFLAALSRDRPRAAAGALLVAMSSTLSPGEMQRLADEPGLAALMDKPLEPAALDALMVRGGRTFVPPARAYPQATRPGP
ncbi:response regulator [Aquicoccus sp. SCR17]|nr:response regulator [Carideicomes alvinocaridis]